jgi:hypothetical protein
MRDNEDDMSTRGSSSNDCLFLLLDTVDLNASHSLNFPTAVTFEGDSVFGLPQNVSLD